MVKVTGNRAPRIQLKRTKQKYDVNVETASLSGSPAWSLRPFTSYWYFSLLGCFEKNSWKSQKFPGYGQRKAEEKKRKD